MIQITKSREPYDKKDKAIAALSRYTVNDWNKNNAEKIKTVEWEEIYTSVEGLLAFLRSGYIITPGLYKNSIDKNIDNNGKVFLNDIGKSINPYTKEGYLNNKMIREQFWTSAWIMFVDVDKTNSRSIEEFINKFPELQPTFAFYTPSDKPDDRRFKLFYVFNQRITSIYDFKNIIKFIHNYISEKTGEIIKDKCGTTPTQICFGSYNCAGYYTGIRYDLDQFKDVIITDEDEIEVEKLNSKDSSAPKKEIEIHSDLIDQLERGFPFKDLYRKSYINTRIITKNEIVWFDIPGIDEKVGLTTTRYWELKHNFGKKYVNGDGRRKKLFLRTCMRRVISYLNGEELSPDDLLLLSYFDMCNIIENNYTDEKDIITIETLVRKVRAACKMKIEDIIEKNRDYIKYCMDESIQILLVSKYGKGRTKLTLKERGRLLKRISDYFIEQAYDKNLTELEIRDKVNENLKNMGVKFRVESKRRIATYKSDNNITAKDSKTERDLFILKKHNEGLSATQIMDELVDNGFRGMSKSQINRVISKFEKNQTSTTNEEKESITQKPTNDDWTKWLFPVSPKV